MVVVTVFLTHERHTWYQIFTSQQYTQSQTPWFFSRILISLRNFQNRPKYQLYSLLLLATVLIPFQTVIIKLLLNLHLKDNSKQKRCSIPYILKINLWNQNDSLCGGGGGRESNVHIPVSHWHLPQHGFCYYIKKFLTIMTWVINLIFFWFIASFWQEQFFPSCDNHIND